MYWKKNSTFIDLRAKKFKRDINSIKIGEMFVDLREKIIPLNAILKIEERNLPKRKILKRYQEVENGGRKE